MREFKIADILKKFQEGVDFTVESKEKVIFHNKKIVDYLEWEQGEAKWFYDTVRKLFTSIVCSYKEKENGGYVFTFESGNNKKDSNQEIKKVEKELEVQKIQNKNKKESLIKIDEQKKNERGLKELSAQKALNKQIDNFFGLEKKNQPQEKENSVMKVSDSNINYNNWTKNQLISEINKLKTEIESLKTNPTLTSSEKQTKIQQNQQQLAQLNNYYSNSVSQLNNSDNSSKPKSNLPTNLAIGGVVLALVGLVSVLVIKKTAKIKK